MQSNLKSRIQEVARSLGYSDRGFCLACGLRADWIHKLGEYIKERDIKKIFDAFPTLNLYYIFLGKSPMFYAESSTKTENTALNYILDDYKVMRIENQQLHTENTLLKHKLSVMLSDMEKLAQNWEPTRKP